MSGETPESTRYVSVHNPVKNPLHSMWTVVNNPAFHLPNPQMTSTVTPSIYRASFAIGSEQVDRRVVDLLTERFFEGQAAIAAFEGPAGRWDITVHFAEAPDQSSIRELVRL